MHQPRLAPSSGETRVRAGSILRAAALGAVPAVGTGHHLLVLAGPHVGQRFAIGHSQTLGRGRDATIRLRDCEVSRLHARICTAGGTARLEDLDSKNGVRLNGKPVRGRWSSLKPGDEITIGSTTIAVVAAADEPTKEGGFETGTCTGTPLPTDQISVRARRMLLRARPALALAGAVALFAAAVCLGIAAM